MKMKTTQLKRLAGAIGLTIVAASPAFNTSNAQDMDAAEPSTAFVVVDDASTSVIGEMPIDRGVIANAVLELRRLGAKAVALKFFYDADRPSDNRLGEAMDTIPVLLQYSLSLKGTDDDVPRGREDLNYSSAKLIRGGASMVPNRKLRFHMKDMGFVDIHADGSHNAVEMIGMSQSSPVASLQLEILEHITGRRAQVTGGQIRIGENWLKLDEEGRVKCDFLETGRLHAIPILDVLDRKIGKEEIEGKVVVIGYSRSDTPVFKTPRIPAMPIHEYFYRQVLCVAKMLR